MNKPHIFLFSGDDSFAVAEKVSLWKREFQKKYGIHSIHSLDLETSFDSEEQARHLFRQALVAQDLFSQTRLVFLKNAFSRHVKKDTENLLDEILPLVPPSHFIVLTAERPDARTTFYKTLQKLKENGTAKIEEFLLPQGANLRSWIKARVEKLGGKIEPSALSSFIAHFESPENNYQKELPYTLWLINHEIEKLVAYARERSITSKDIDLLVPQKKDAHVFSLTDALLSKNTKRATILFSELLSEGNHKTQALSVTALLTSQFRDLLRIKLLKSSGASEQQIASELSWNPKRVWVVGKKVQMLSEETLKATYSRLLEIDCKLKSTSLNPGTLLQLLFQEMSKIKS